MSVYVLPSLLGLLFKLFILVYAVKDKRISATILMLILVFACHNLIEFVGYIQFLDEKTVSALFRAYYVATIVILAVIPIHSLHTTRTLTDNRVVPAGITVAAAAMIIGVLFTNLIVAGNFSIGYALTAIEGPYFKLFVLFLVLTLASSVWILARGYLNSEKALDSTRSLYSMAALAPLLLVLGFGIVFKIIGVKLNFAGVLPLASTFFVFMILKTESKHQLTDIRRFIPFSKERRASVEILRLMDSYSQCTGDTDAYQELRNGIERQAVQYTLDKCDHNITQAAKMMGLQNRSTLYSMIKRLDIEIQDRRLSSNS